MRSARVRRQSLGDGSSFGPSAICGVLEEPRKQPRLKRGWTCPARSEDRECVCPWHETQHWRSRAPRHQESAGVTDKRNSGGGVKAGLRVLSCLNPGNRMETATASERNDLRLATARFQTVRPTHRSKSKEHTSELQ